MNRNLGIFPCPTAHTGRARNFSTYKVYITTRTSLALSILKAFPGAEARNFSNFQSLYVGRKVCTHMTIRNSLCSVLRSSKSHQSLYGESSEFFYIQALLYTRRKAYMTTLRSVLRPSRFQSLYGGGQRERGGGGKLRIFASPEIVYRGPQTIW